MEPASQPAISMQPIATYKDSANANRAASPPYSILRRKAGVREPAEPYVPYVLLIYALQ